MSDKNFEHELKKEFQLERMILFSDAVFAIAITLLVIEMKVPEIPKDIVSDDLLLHSLDHLMPKFIGFIISFIIIGLYWVIHHRMFGFVVNYTKRTLALNLIFLFGVVLMPFSTAFYSEYILRLLKVPMVVYVSNVCFLGIMNFILWKHLTSPSLRLTEGVDKAHKRRLSFTAITIPLTFAIAAIIYFINPRVALYAPLFIAVIVRLIRKFIIDKKERPAKPNNSTSA